MFFANAFLPISIQEPVHLLPWLKYESGSLTEKLQLMTGDAQIMLLQQSWSQAAYWDKQVLALNDMQVFKREILMYSNQRACWYAKTIIPETCYNLDKIFFNQLNNGVLTPLIFKEPKVFRQRLFHYAINPNCLEYYWVNDFNSSKISPLWLRFSNFQFLKSHEFYLIEIFLPDFLELLYD